MISGEDLDQDQDPDQENALHCFGPPCASVTFV